MIIQSRIALTVGSLWSDDLDDSQIEPPCIFHVHMLPPANMHRMPFHIISIPCFIWTLLRGKIIKFQFCPVEPWSSLFACVRRGWLIKALVAFQPSQSIEWQSTQLTPEGYIASVKQDQRTLRKLWHDLLSLFKSDLNICFIGRNTLLIYNEGPTTRFLRQNSHRQLLPSKGDGSRFPGDRVWDSMHRHRRSIR